MQTQQSKIKTALSRRNVEEIGIAGGHEMLRCKRCGHAWALLTKPGGGYYRGSQNCSNGCSKG